MELLLKTIAAELVEDKDAITVTRDEPNEDGITVYHLHVAQDDMGRIIGKKGRIAKAIRTLMRAGAAKVNEKVMVEIE
ncbi:MAG: KH domain-containing protein [Oscillospiraceae bacterium]|nr:KH domain-containing protein [Oscillospiraceae bacterium]